MSLVHVAMSVPLSRKIREALEADIILGDLAPGHRIDEKLVASRFGASRTPVREALHQLASSGLVVLRPHQGAVVAELTLPTLIEMFEAMAACEGFCARLAARRIRRDEFAALREIHLRCEAQVKADDALAFLDSNMALHETIYAASRNSYLIEQTRALRVRLSPYRRYATFHIGRMRASIDEHAAVLDAIGAGQADKAEAAMRAHLSLLGEGFTDLVAGLKGNVMGAAVMPSFAREREKASRRGRDG